MIRKLFKLILLLVGLSAIGVAFLAGTQKGLEVTFAFLQRNNPELISIGKLQGQLVGPIRFQQLEFASANTEVRIESGALTWQPSKLLQAKLEIKHINLDKVQINQLKSGDSSESLYLPLAININSGIITNLNYNHADLKKLIQSHEIELTAKVNSQGKINLVGHWHGLNYQDSRENIHSPYGKLDLNGDVNAYELSSQGNLHGNKQIPAVNWNLQATGNSSELRIEQFATQLLDGNITISGKLNWQQDLAWDLTTQAEHLQLTELPYLHGKQINYKLVPCQAKDTALALNLCLRSSTVCEFHDTGINFQINSTGNYSKEALNIKLNIANLAGKYQELPVVGHGKINYAKDRVQVDDLNIAVGTAKIIANGNLDQDWDLNWLLDIPNLNKLLPDMHGKIYSSGSIIGEQLNPIVTGKLEVEKFSNAYLNINSLSSLFKFDPLHKTAENIQLTAKQSKLAGLEFATVNLQATGDHQHQNIAFSLVNSDSKIQGKISSKLEQDSWQANITQLKIQDQQHGTWDLSHSANITLRPDQVISDDICLTGKIGTVCSKFDWQRQKQIQVSGYGKQLPIDLLNKYFKSPIIVEGKTDFSLQAKKISGKNWLGDINLKLGKSKLTYHATDQTHIFNFNQGTLHARIIGQGLESKIQLSRPKMQPILVMLELPSIFNQNINLEQQPIQGSVKLISNDLSLLPILAPEIYTPTGNLNIDLKISGNIGQPHIAGNINLSQGQVTIPRLGVKFTDINAKIAADDRQPLSYTATAKSAKGSLALTGTTDLRQTGLPTILKIQGNDVRVMQTPQAKINVSPNLEVKINGKNINLSGEITVPEAKFSPDDFSNSVTMSDDVVFVNKENQIKKELPFWVTSNIQLTLGELVNLDFMGLRADLGGSLSLRDSPGRATTAIGQLFVRQGKYTAYGQKLSIETGQLIFTGGPITNPGLNIEAVHQQRTIGRTSNREDAITSSSDLTVGVRITGTIREPRVVLFSDPPGYSQSDILSYLVLGRPIDSSGKQDATVLLKALSALQLGSSQSSMVEEQVQHRLGLDELAIGTTENYDPKSDSVVQNTTLMLGKALSPNLFINYGIGLVDPVNILKINYKLGDSWTLQSDMDGNSSGIDIFYSIERD